MTPILTLPARFVNMSRLSAKTALPKTAVPAREPVAAQIRDYYTRLHTDYILLQRRAALARVQQALEPLTAGLISTCGG